MCDMCGFNFDKICRFLSSFWSQSQVAGVYTYCIMDKETDFMGKEISLRNRQRIKEARLIDNAFMNAFFDNNNEAVEFILRIILNDKDIMVIDSKVESVLKNLQGRDVILDIHAVDGCGNEMNIEIQRSPEGASRKRARYHSAMLDSHMLSPNQAMDELKDSYVIFITESDVLECVDPLYKIERKILNTNEQFNDGEHIIYVNGADQDSTTELGRLMHDFFCADPDEMNYPILAKKSRQLKTTKAGGSYMESFLDKCDRELIENRNIEIAMMLINRGKDSYEEIAEISGLPVEKVAELARDKAV